MPPLPVPRLAPVAEGSGPGIPGKTYEGGLSERTVLIEFDSLEAAIAAHDSPGYAAALAALTEGQFEVFVLLRQQNNIETIPFTNVFKD